jgi:hypothetical protein
LLSIKWQLIDVVRKVANLKTRQGRRGDKGCVKESTMIEHSDTVSDRGESAFLKFRSDKTVVHFSEHGNSIKHALGRKSYSLAEYLDDANHVIRHGIFVPELNGYVRLLVAGMPGMPA